MALWIAIIIFAAWVIYEGIPELLFHPLHLSVLFRRSRRLSGGRLSAHGHLKSGVGRSDPARARMNVDRKSDDKANVDNAHTNKANHLTPSNIVALTFDDGPDPRYTPQVLDILAAHRAKATFFLVGKRAASHPELVQRILDGGHEIGNHSWNHLNAWIQTPWRTYREIARTKALLEQTAKRNVIYYRPPWGMFNLFTRHACAVVGHRPVLWSVSAYDWRKGDTTAEIIRRVSSATAGDIVLMHDNGGAPEAPLNTIRALPVILEDLTQKGYVMGTITELLGS